MVDEETPASGASGASQVAIALIAGSVMLFQVGLTRVFSYLTWHHLGFMVISVALLGFAVSGVLLQVVPALGDADRRTPGRAALAAALSMVAVVAALAPLAFDPTRLGEPGQLAQLLLVYGLLVTPFAAAGLAIVCLLRQSAKAIGRLYAADLVGAGAGSLLAIPLLGWCGGDGLVAVAAGLCAAAGGLLGSPRPAARWGQGALALALVLGAPAFSQWLALRPTSGKAIVSMLDGERFPQAELTFTGWNAISRVDVVERSARVSWSVNTDSPSPPPPQTLIVIDGDAATPVVHRQGRAGELDFLDYTLSSTAPQAFAPREVLVIGSGGGIDVLTALRNGAERLDAVEVNPVVAQLASEGRFASQGGEVFADPRVALHVEDGRSFVRRSRARYDLIQLSLIDTWAASMSGAYSLSEGYLYTQEAFVDYLTHLSEDGVLSMTRWLGTPPRESLRVSAVAAAALEQLGVTDPAACVAVVHYGNMANTLIKRRPFSAAELERLRGVAASRGFDFVHLPGHTADNDIARFFQAADPAAFLASYPFRVTPTRDDSPFFFQFTRWADLAELRRAWTDGNYSARLLLLLVLAQAGVLSGLLLAAPLKGGAAVPWRALLYFGGIGLGFMLLEVSLMQRYTLFLGNPTYAFALVLATLLIGAGVGSALQPRLEGRASWVFGGLAAAIVLHALVVPALLDRALLLGSAGRIALSVATLLPLGVLLGVPFPLALARLARGPERVVGWAWAANGCASVIGPVLAVLLAIDVGFTWVQLGAAVVYGLVFGVLPRDD